MLDNVKCIHLTCVFLALLLMCLTGGAGDHRDCGPPGGHTRCRGKQRKVLNWNAVKDGTFNDNAQNLDLSCILLRILCS